MKYPIHFISVDGLVESICVDGSGVFYVILQKQGLWKLDKTGELELLCPYDEIGGIRNIAWDENFNSIFLCSQTKRRIFRYDIETGILSLFADKHFFSLPTGLIIDKNADAYVMDDKLLKKIPVKHQAVEILAKHNEFKYLAAICIAEDGTIYLCDEQNHAIKKYKDGKVHTLLNSSKSLLYPFDIVYEGQDKLLVLDRIGIHRINIRSGVVSELPRIKKPRCLFSDKNGNIFIGLKGSIVKLEDMWNLERLLWIAHMKENPENCVLATLPKELIKEVLHYVVCAL